MVSAAKFVETVKTAYIEKWGYIYATAGVDWTKTKQNNLKAKYESDPNKYSDYKLSAELGDKWIGHKVSDCSGLPKWALIQNGSNCPHGSNSIWRNSLSEKGPIDKNTEIAPGELVFKLRNGTDYHHVGVYIGDGYVIEAQGTRTGVIRSKLSTWGYHGKLKVVDYSEEKHEEEIPMQGDYKVTAKEGKSVRLRKGPSMSANILYEVPVGSDVKVLASNDGWATVQYTVQGYMKTDFLIKK